jgi:site-specific DNA-cytosine methylase
VDLPKLRGLSLFSGIGGDTLALSPYVETIAYCEKDKYCQSVLLSRMSDGLIAKAPIWDDIRTLSSTVLPEGIDVIYGGSVGQNYSLCLTRFLTGSKKENKNEE